MLPRIPGVDTLPRMVYLPLVIHGFFGCGAHASIPDQKRGKLDGKSTRSLFIGYPDGYKGYKLYDPNIRKVFISRDVVFDENKVGITEIREVAVADDEPEFGNIDTLENEDLGEEIYDE